MATILGLLLVVTFIANYIATTLPNTMGQNDLQHELQVETQVALLSARAQAIAESGMVGAQVSQPISLGGQGAPPFAAPDGAYLSPLSSVSNVTGNYPRSSIGFNLSGPTLYVPPTGFGVTHSALPSGCSGTSTTITCPGINKGFPIRWNFTGQNGATYTVSLGTGGNLVNLNFSTNSSTIALSGVSGMSVNIQIYGNNDSFSLNNNGGKGVISINITGSYDTILPNSFAGGQGTVIIHVVGDHDVINGDASTSGGSNTFYVSIVGTSDSLLLTPSGGDAYYAFVTGFDSLNPSSALCPYGALAHNNVISGYNNAIGTSQNAKLYETFNNSTSYPGGGTVHPGTQGGPPYKFTITNSSVAAFACPYTSAVLVPVAPSGVAGFVVHMQNTYAPGAEVAYDQGAVIYAQTGGLPIFIVPPPVTLAGGTLTVFLPWFSVPVPGEAGLGTADVSLRVLSSTSLTFPENGFSFVSGSSIVIKWTTPYAASWYAYFHALPTYASYVTCAGSNNVCSSNTLYNPAANHALGTVTLTIPAAGLTLDVLATLFAPSVL